MDLRQFVSPFRTYDRLLSQHPISLIDIVDLPVTFVEYKVLALIRGTPRMTRFKDVATVWLSDRKYIVSLYLLSVSKEFYIIHNWVSKRIFDGEISCISLLEAAKLYLYVNTADAGAAVDMYTEAMTMFEGYQTIEELNKYEEVIESNSLLIDGVEFADKQVVNDPRSNGLRVYFPIIDYKFMLDDRMEFLTWDFTTYED